MDGVQRWRGIGRLPGQLPCAREHKKAVQREATVTSALQKTVTAYFSNMQLLSFCFARQTVPRSCDDNEAHRSAAPAVASAAAPAAALAVVSPGRLFIMTQDTEPLYV